MVAARDDFGMVAGCALVATIGSLNDSVDCLRGLTV